VITKLKHTRSRGPFQATAVGFAPSLDPYVLPLLGVQQLPASPPRPPKSPGPPHWVYSWGRRIAWCLLGLAVAGICLLTIDYFRLAREIDKPLARGPFASTVDIYGAPSMVSVGDELTAAQLATRLRQSSYTTISGSPIGWYDLQKDAIEIFPGKDADVEGEPAVLYFAGGKLSRIVSLSDHTDRTSYELPPQLLANLSENHEERRLAHFADLPPDLVNAVISVEDKRFFSHSGIDFLRLAKAAYIDLKAGRKEQGASTLTMQLARSLWLRPQKKWRRKFEEIAITLHLERKLGKRQIFEDYANQVYLGQRGAISISGFGEAARFYLGKDVSQLDLPEAALLAGLIQRPSYYNPYRYPDRAVERRNLVLTLMRQNGYLSDERAEKASAQPIVLAPEHSETLETSYFLDVANEELQARLDDHEHSSRYVFTTLDPDLQAAAEAAVKSGMEFVDQQLRKRKAKEQIPPGQPQVALVALDPHTGEVRALVGGRDYGASQLDHTLAKRQPGSVFKPFVYAAALNTALNRGTQIFTPATVINDSPATFLFNGKAYSPDNFDQKFMGDVTLRDALAHSLNVATVKLAQEVGYGKVVALARRAGLNGDIEPTPAVALGAYEATPLEIAGAYTVFANGGTRVSPTTVTMVRSRNGEILYEHWPDPRPVLDPRVNYLMVSMLEDVLRMGTGAAVRARGFELPAAGKTGTSRDGWFAGFTSRLLCVVWVGFDDNRELHLEGARSALPIWTDFMKRAAKLRAYRDAKPFVSPRGLVSLRICSDSGELARPACPRTRMETFIEGTEPTLECQLHKPQPQPDENVEDRTVEPTSPKATIPEQPQLDGSPAPQ
jgi:penicillin-binding protein 1B